MNNKKKFKPRVGDWICFECKKNNFKERITCYRCNIDKAASDIKTM